jgi:uracil-DNA glycosylase
MVREFQLLNKLAVIVPLGSFAYNAVKKLLRQQPQYKKFRFPAFGHGVKVDLLNGQTIVCSYHPSQQNTFTGKLTREMFLSVFQRAKRLAAHAG